jgi:hypothetical protein
MTERPGIIYTSATIPYRPAPEPDEPPEPRTFHESALKRSNPEHARMHGIPRVRLCPEAAAAVTAMELHLEAWQAGIR